MESKSTISDNATRRFPRYLRALEQLKAQERRRISSAELGKLIGVSASQIRTDFNSFGIFGQQGYGYEIASLCEEIRHILGMDCGFKAILVGAGNLGRALISNFDICRLGLRLIAAFDTAPSLHGTDIHGLPVLPMDTADALIQREQIDLAILTVPQSAARLAVSQLEAAGIRAIWNFTNIDIGDASSGLLIEDMNFDDSLLTLLHYMKSRREGAPRLSG